MKVATYLEFKDNAQEVIDVYQAIFDAEVVLKYLYDAQMTDDPALVGKVFHAELKIGGMDLYLCDGCGDPAFPSTKLVVEIQDAKEAERIFDQLAEGGKVIREFTKMSFGPTIGDVQDRFGIRWNVVIC